VSWTRYKELLLSYRYCRAEGFGVIGSLRMALVLQRSDSFREHLERMRREMRDAD